jgi:hypothetical protein
MPVPMVSRSKPRMVLDRSNTEIMGSNPARGMNASPRLSVLSCLGTGVAMDRCPVQGVLPKYLKKYSVSEVHSESEQDRGPKHETYNKVIIHTHTHTHTNTQCIHKFLDWPPGARTENDTALCH